MSYNEQLIEFITKGCVLCKNPTGNKIILSGVDSKVFEELHMELKPFIIEEDNSSFIVSYLGSEIALVKHD